MPVHDTLGDYAALPLRNINSPWTVGDTVIQGRVS
jgi:hypothetical protein